MSPMASSTRRLFVLLATCTAHNAPLCRILREEIENQVSHAMSQLDKYRFLTSRARELEASLRKMGTISLDEKGLEGLHAVTSVIEQGLQNLQTLLAEAGSNVEEVEKPFDVLTKDAHQRVLMKRTEALKDALWEKLSRVPLNTIREAEPSSIKDVNALGESLRRIRAVSPSAIQNIPVNILQTLKGHGAAILALAVADGKIVSGSNDNTIRIWDLATGQHIRTLKGHNGAVLALAVADGKIVSGSRDNTIRIWDISFFLPNVSNLTREQVLNVFAPQTVTDLAEYAPSPAFALAGDLSEHIGQILGDSSITFCIERSAYERFMKECRVL